MVNHKKRKISSLASLDCLKKSSGLSISFLLSFGIPEHFLSLAQALNKHCRLSQGAVELSAPQFDPAGVA